MEALIISIIWFLVGVVIVGGLIWLVFYVFNKISGEPIPAKVQQVVWILFLLICILLLILRVWPLVSRLIH